MDDISELKGRCNHTYLTGVFLAVNAVPDLFLLLDGPRCGYDLALGIYKNHDIFSQLFKRDGRHRICCSWEYGTNSLNLNHIDNLYKQFSEILSDNQCNYALVCSMPASSISGIDYTALIKNSIKKTDKPIGLLPSKSMDADWLSGYEEVMISLAHNIILSDTKKRKGKVAIVGYFFDRNEGDNIGNITELKRILNELSLDLVSVWFNGKNISSLKEIQSAELIISFPYGRTAAKIISEKTGAEILEVGLPLGIQNTKEFIYAIGKKLNLVDRSEKMLNKELSRVIPLVKDTIPLFFQGRKFCISTDPCTSIAISDIINELGGIVQGVFIYSSLGSDKTNKQKSKTKEELKYELKVSEMMDKDFSECDLFIGNSHAIAAASHKNKELAFLEIGFPSYRHHSLVLSPNLGFNGFINFINRLINSLELIN